MVVDVDPLDGGEWRNVEKFFDVAMLLAGFGESGDYEVGFFGMEMEAVLAEFDAVECQRETLRGDGVATEMVNECFLIKT